MTANLIAGVDVGGTFTDVVLFDAREQALGVTKVPSTPRNQADGVRNGLHGVIRDLGHLDKLVHGTTVSTNTMLQASGARIALVTTRGFRDILEIGRTRRMLPSLYDTTFVRPPPLVPRPLRFEVTERLNADGTVLTPLDEAELERIAAAIRASGAEAVAICFLHAHVNAAHEVRAKECLERALPGVWITTSSEVVPEFREYERFSTTAINAYLLPVMDRYMSSLRAKLGDAGYRGDVFTMSSGGGIMDLDAARAMPVRTILSGPAGGVSGALWIARAANLRNFITCDMGGTSTDVCLIENLHASSVSETAFAGYPIKGREVAINTVGAGGGSIASMESGRTLKVGPRSAGAEPGPACYGRGGTEPTVTDANVVLGRLGPRVLGGVIRPDIERARAAVGALASQLGVAGVEAMAEGIVRIAVAQMANAIREISLECGYDPSEFVLLPFGGAGPMHAAQIAEEIGVTEILVPILPGNLSALGLLASDQRYERVRTFRARLASLEPARLARALAEHEADEGAALAQRGFAPEAIRFVHALDMRYVRQAFELTVELPVGAREPDALRRQFLDAYARHYGRADDKSEIEIVNLRTTAIGLTDHPRFPPLRASADRLADAVIAQRPVIVAARTLNASVYERERLPVDAEFDGPAIVEEDGSTTVVLPGWRGRRDDRGNLRLSTT
ncbi:MAG TPA: hydantoinase/oxoprolinase family protein [Casimicrobiaceae bacterium]|nr:hydantoinase/oxoprolinase family protein [Casimicrobiaceae bacterium]